MTLSLTTIFVAAVFLASGLGKLTARGAVSPFIEQLGIPRTWSPAISIVVPAAEVLLGLLLVTGITLRPAAVASAVVASAFLAAQLVALTRGGTASCRCFGVLDTALRPAVSTLRAAMFLAATVALVILAAASPHVTPATVAGGILAAVSYILAFHLINETAILVSRDRQIHEGLVAAAKRLDQA